MEKHSFWNFQQLFVIYLINIENCELQICQSNNMPKTFGAQTVYKNDTLPTKPSELNLLTSGLLWCPPLMSGESAWSEEYVVIRTFEDCSSLSKSAKNGDRQSVADDVISSRFFVSDSRPGKRYTRKNIESAQTTRIRFRLFLKKETKTLVRFRNNMDSLGTKGTKN